MKIISKENSQTKIEFNILTCKIDPNTGKVFSEETRYRSIGKGVTNRQFNEIVDTIISKLPKDVEIKIHDLSHYSSLKEQFSIGVMDGILRTSLNQLNEWL